MTNYIGDFGGLSRSHFGGIAEKWLGYCTGPSKSFVGSAQTPVDQKTITLSWKTEL
jgi:hypothetical protein